MNSYPTNGGGQPQAQTQPPAPSDDPNPTRYFPPQETPRPEAPNSGYNSSYNGEYYASAGPSPSQQAGAGYAPQSYQQINQTTHPYKWSADRRDRDRSILALILIGGGLLFLLDQFSFFPNLGGLILLLMGGIFMYAYFSTKPGYRIGFLIPGAILSGVGAGVFLEGFPILGGLFGGNIVPLTLGVGFCTIWFFERRHWWALIPGGVLLLVGLSGAFRVFALWPLVLIGLGVYLLYAQSRRRSRY